MHFEEYQCQVEKNERNRRGIVVNSVFQRKEYKEKKERKFEKAEKINNIEEGC